MNLEVVILAAGQGSRMKSALPKVLHPLGGKPLLAHVIDTAEQLAPDAIHVVVGHGTEAVRSAMSEFDINWVEQSEQLGTGHAVAQALPHVSPESVVLVLYGDVPLAELSTLQRLSGLAQKAPALLTARLGNPSGYGRILRNEHNALVGVVEDKDASDTQRGIDEVNTGLLAAPCADLAEYLPRVSNTNQQAEYYLPDILSLAVAAGKTVLTCEAASEIEILGVNDRVQLNQVEREYQRRQAHSLMREGVSFADASRVDIRGELTCGDDVSIDVNAVFEGRVHLEDNVQIGANCVLRDARIGQGTIIHPMSHLQEVDIAGDCSFGPFARLRPGTALQKGAKIGNFVETKKARIGQGSKVNHLSYIGDCDMGSGVNVGAGTITCNYDGANKHRTEMGDGVFVGSNSTLVAPLTIENQGFVGAGSTITSKVGSEELVVSRARQRNIQGWKRPEKKENRD